MKNTARYLFVLGILFTGFVQNHLYAAEKINQSINLAGNRQATWYIPDGQADTWVILQHGFQRNKSNMDHFATTLMNNGFLVLTLNTSVTGGNPSLASDMADAVIDSMPLPPNNYPLPSQLILSGHSAGALFVTHLGARLMERGDQQLVGAILLDPVDANDGMGDAMQAMVNAGRPVYSILANASSCNSSNNAVGPLNDLTSAFVGIKLTNNSKHTDAEGDSTGGIITWLCGSPKDYNVVYLQDFALNWALDMSAGTINPDYYPGGSKIAALIAAEDGELIKQGAVTYPPQADFAFSANELSVQFSDQSQDADGSIDSYAWDFGDGSSSALASPSHTYSSAGTYNVSLTVTDNDGLTGSINKSVTVVNGGIAPNAAFSFSVDQFIAAFTDTSSDSDGSIVQWSWDFGDGNGSNATNPMHTYGSPGTYNVTLTVTDDDGLTDSVTQAVTMTSGGGLANPTELTDLAAAQNQALNYFMDVPAGAADLNFTISGGSGDADIYIRFGTAPTTSQYDYRPYKNGNDEVVDIATPQAGTWYIMIRGYRAYSGLKFNASYKTPGDNMAPRAAFSSSASGLSVSFTDESSDSDGSIVSRLWSFGDGSQSTDANPSHRYSQAGTYTVTLAVSDDDNASDSVSQSVVVTDASDDELQNGQARTDLAADTGQELHFVLNVPANALNAQFVITGGSGDADVYVRYGAKPTQSEYDYRPYRYGNEETVTVAGPQAGQWFVMVRAYNAFSGVSLTGSYDDNE
ncbi:PKD domain-containing protein [Pleionea litopenaei]|uniref:PKD domain-containing protein n=1 Tax=Pleionea litopenaei TaxID=3070815 RepID=A0AA51RX39_9GAMM|nr:PKD domain-containing protein [Pleionea sp. HL-JVS1]WMS89119.1 PKD domain-containing protein [Pleionea sp. HL-JVS1]